MDERAAGVERELYKAKVRASKVEQEFRQQKECTDAFMNNAECLVRKLKGASG